jgi:creatine kinase
MTPSAHRAATRFSNGALGSAILLSLFGQWKSFSEEETKEYEGGLHAAGPTRTTRSVLDNNTILDPFDTFVHKSRLLLTRTSCDKLEKRQDSYPNFSRHGNSSYLKKYLTPEVYEELRHKQTSSGITLEDIIQSGVELPWGAIPPRGFGVFVGDAECYRVFAPLLDPMIAEYHHTPRQDATARGLRRHSTNLDPEMVLSQRPDPTGEYILFTRMRVARSIEGFGFAPSISRSSRRYLHRLVKDCVEDWEEGKFVSIYEMTNEEHDDLIRRHICFHDPDAFAIYGGLGRDWPDARGIYCNDWIGTPNVMIWCNAEDHIRVVSMRKGGDLHGVFAALSYTVQAMEKALHQRGHHFVYDDRLGYVSAIRFIDDIMHRVGERDPDVNNIGAMLFHLRLFLRVWRVTNFFLLPCALTL